MKDSQPQKSIWTAVTAALKEPGMLIGLGTALALFATIAFIPVIGVFFGSLTPFPLIYYYARRGRTFGLTMIVLAAALVILLFLSVDRPFGGLIFLEYSALALALGEGILQRRSPGRVIGLGVGAVLLMTSVLLAWGGVGQGQGPWSFAQAVVRQQVQESLELYEALMTQDGKPVAKTVQKDPRPGSAQIEPLNKDEEDPATRRSLGPRDRRPQVMEDRLSENVLNPAIELLIKIFPGLMILGTTLITWANFMLVRVVLARVKALPESLADLKAWRGPEWLVWVLIFCGFSLFLPWDLLQALGMNGLLVLVIVYFFQGLSVTAFWLHRKKAPLFIRTLLFTLVALQQYLALVIAVIGLFDLWFDFRKLKSAGPGLED